LAPLNAVLSPLLPPYTVWLSALESTSPPLVTFVMLHQMHGLPSKYALHSCYSGVACLITAQEVDIGIAADVGTLAYLPKITGNMSLVRELAYTADWFSAAEAEKAGLVSRVVEGGRDEVLAASIELAKRIASKSPVAVAGTKKLITHARDHRRVSI